MLQMSRKNISDSPSAEFLVETRDELMVMLFELGHGPTEIGIIMNRSKQMVQHVIKKNIKIIKKAHANKKSR